MVNLLLALFLVFFVLVAYSYLILGMLPMITYKYQKNIKKDQND